MNNRYPDARRCTDTETRALLAHLFEDKNAHWCANPLAAGRLAAWIMTIRDRDQFGAISTNFAELGTVLAKTAVGRDLFLVRDVAPVLKRPDCNDDPLRSAVAKRVDAERRGALEDRAPTVLLTPAGLLLCDGHKRSVAIYEAGLAQNFEVPIHVLTVPQ